MSAVRHRHASTRETYTQQLLAAVPMLPMAENAG
jgi:hypothetical protein